MWELILCHVWEVLHGLPLVIAPWQIWLQNRKSTFIPDFVSTSCLVGRPVRLLSPPHFSFNTISISLIYTLRYRSGIYEYIWVPWEGALWLRYGGLIDTLFEGRSLRPEHLVPVFNMGDFIRTPHLHVPYAKGRLGGNTQRPSVT